MKDLQTWKVEETVSPALHPRQSTAQLTSFMPFFWKVSQTAEVPGAWQSDGFCVSPHADVIRVSVPLDATEKSQTLLSETDIDFHQEVLSSAVITTAALIYQIREPNKFSMSRLLFFALG